MSESQPTAPVLVVDVPGVTDINVRFVYNYWVADETVSQTNTITGAIKKPSVLSNTSSDSAGVGKLPRYNIISWTPVTSTPLPPGITAANISENLNKVVYEDQFSPTGFTTIQFSDGEIVNKVYSFVSSSIQISSLYGVDQNLTPRQNSFLLNAITPSSVTSAFINATYNNPEKTGGVRWDSRSTGFERVRIGLEDVDKVAIPVRINNLVLKDILDAAFLDPSFNHSDSLDEFHKKSSGIKSAAQSGVGSTDNSQYKTYVEPVSVTYGYSSTVPTRSSQSIIGYIIEKVEITRTNSVVHHDPIIVESPYASVIADPNIKYGSKYAYYIRAVAQVRSQLIDDSTSDLCLADILMASTPSRAGVVHAIEEVSPPPPGNINYVWDYATDTLQLHWDFPGNSQRDIKKFQIFRRDNLSSSFELLCVYDFDDSVQPYITNNVEDSIDDGVTLKLSSPRCDYLDHEFTKDSSYIYAVCAIDAHGYSSNYSQQFLVSWDSYKNQLKREFISHSGAPKSYPNMYLESDAFIDTIKTEGLKNCEVYLTPEHLQIIHDGAIKENVLETDVTGGSYQISFIDIDNGRTILLPVKIFDLRTKTL